MVTWLLWKLTAHLISLKRKKNPKQPKMSKSGGRDSFYFFLFFLFLNIDIILRNSIREIRVSFNWPGKIKLWEGYFQPGERIPVIAHAGTPRPLLVLNLLAFICLRITCQLNLVIACVIRKQTIPFAPALPNLYICTPCDVSVWDGEGDGQRRDESVLISATFSLIFVCTILSTGVLKSCEGLHKVHQLRHNIMSPTLHIPAAHTADNSDSPNYPCWNNDHSIYKFTA